MFPHNGFFFFFLWRNKKNTVLWGDGALYNNRLHRHVCDNYRNSFISKYNLVQWPKACTGMSAIIIGTLLYQNITLSSDLRLLVPSYIMSNRKLKLEVTGHQTRFYLTFLRSHAFFLKYVFCVKKITSHYLTYFASYFRSGTRDTPTIQRSARYCCPHMWGSWRLHAWRTHTNTTNTMSGEKKLRTVVSECYFLGKNVSIKQKLGLLSGNKCFSETESRSAIEGSVKVEICYVFRELV